MKFEAMLAKRYIFAQKRHSIFTICSIVVAVSLMSMMFTLYSTLMGCLRAAAYDSTPYHMRFYSITKEQAALLSEMDEIKETTLKENKDGTVIADIMFKKGKIDHIESFGIKAAEKIGRDEDYYEQCLSNGLIDINGNLISLDVIDFEARFRRLQILCLFYIIIIFIAMSLRMVIDTAFEISSKEREKQFGVLQSIGATPHQTVNIITIEGLLLSAIGIPIGVLLGITIAFIAFRTVLTSGIADAFFTAEEAAAVVHFKVDPFMILLSILTSLLWIMLSAYGTGMRIIRKSPIESILARKNGVKRIRRHSISGLIFGWEGKLASRNSRREKKRFFITILSLTLSITLYASGMTVIDKFMEAADESFSMYVTGDFIGTIKGSEYPLKFMEGYQELTDCGYFDNIRLIISEVGISSDENETKYLINYVNEEQFYTIFSDDCPVSYEDLKSSGKYIMTSADGAPEYKDHIDLKINKRIFLQGDYLDKEYIDMMRDSKIEEITVGFDIADSAASNDPNYYYYAGSNIIFLYAPYELFLSRAKDFYGNMPVHPEVLFDLADAGVYHEALHFLEENEDKYDVYDEYSDMNKMRTTISAIDIVVKFVTALLVLTAIVNLANIVSTGIVNRRAEIASMQCVGMTKGQLYITVIVECIHYALIAGISAALLCILVELGTNKMLYASGLVDYYDYQSDINIAEEFIDYTEPLGKVLVGAAAAFVVSIPAAVIPIKAAESMSLADQIRNPD